MKHGEVLHICHISRIKPGAENPEQKWRTAESMKCKFFKQLQYILETVSGNYDLNSLTYYHVCSSCALYTAMQAIKF